MQSKNRSVRSTVHCFVHIHLRNTESDNLSQIRVEFNVSEVYFLHAHLSQEKLLWNKIFYRYKQVFTFLLHFVTILSITCQVSIKILRRLSDPACPHLSSGVTGLPCWSSTSCHCLFCPNCVGVSNQWILGEPDPHNIYNRRTQTFHEFPCLLTREKVSIKTTKMPSSLKSLALKVGELLDSDQVL